jgi:hypothetical protein
MKRLSVEGARLLQLKLKQFMSGLLKRIIPDGMPIHQT